MKIVFSIISLAFIALITAFISRQQMPQAPPDLPFVKDIDFHRFMGVWYNIASLPNPI